MKLLFELFLTFAKIGLFTFGGGYAMLPLIERNCVEKKGWLSSDEMFDITVLAESTPGPVAINCATFVGNKKKGFVGALFSTLGMIIPSFTVIFIISLFFERFMEIQWVASAFFGIKLAVGILIIDAAIRLIKKLPKNVLTVTVAVVSFTAMLLIDIFSLNISSLVLLLSAVALGLTVYLIRKKTEGGKAQ
jgi:chromate transporter